MTLPALLRRALPKPLAELLRSLRREPAEDHATHPERLAILPYVRGRTLEVGCGHRKTAEQVVGVDLTPGGHRGTVGNAAGQESQADVAASGEALPFAAESFDSVIARHNLEHYIDTAGVLIEWRRVLKPGGTLAVILPDEENFPSHRGRTLDLDPTHYHGYSMAALGRLVQLVGGFVDLSAEVVVPQWSFLLTASKEAGHLAPLQGG
ncbi:MAG: class I SAM-dependent methyltransferase [Acidimicrobiales bacterium]